MEKNTIGPVYLILRYAKYTKEKCHFYVKRNQQDTIYVAELHLKGRIYIGGGSSKKEARRDAAAYALTKLNIPDFLKEHMPLRKLYRTAPSTSNEQICNYKEVRHKRLSSLNHTAHIKGYRKMENLGVFVTKTEGSATFGYGFTAKEAKSDAAINYSSLESDYSEELYKISLAECD